MNPRQKEILKNYITDHFIWNFKKGDNIIYNLEILWVLYESKKISNSDKQTLFNKPITITIVSIIECILSDFVVRLQQRTEDPLPNITPEIVNQIKYKGKNTSKIREIKKFIYYIDQVKKHKLFGDNVEFYDELGELRDIRNGVHIQKATHDELVVYTDENLLRAQSALETILSYMIEVYPRTNMPKYQASDIPLPWKN